MDNYVDTAHALCTHGQRFTYRNLWLCSPPHAISINGLVWIQNEDSVPTNQGNLKRFLCIFPSSIFHPWIFVPVACSRTTQSSKSSLNARLANLHVGGFVWLCGLRGHGTVGWMTTDTRQLSLCVLTLLAPAVLRHLRRNGMLQKLITFQVSASFSRF